jgi:PAS domain S-box-containing protein
VSDSEARFVRIFQASPIALGMSTLADGRILDVNEAWGEIFGYRREEAIGRNNAELGISVDLKARSAAIERLQRDGMFRNMEARVRHKTGEELDLLVSAVIIDLGPDKVALSACLDITDQKKAEAERDRLLASETEARAQAEGALVRLRAIESITDSALRHLGLDELLHELLARLRRALDTEHATVLLVADDGQSLYTRAGDGYEKNPNVRVEMGHGVSGRIAAEGRPLVVDDYNKVDIAGISGIPHAQLRNRVESVMGVPLRIGGQVVGVVVVSSERARQFTEDELKLMEVVADRISPAVELARLAERLRDGRAQQRVLARRLLTAHEEERRRLAVELHDELGQILTAVRIDLAALERLAGGGRASAHLRAAVQSVDGAMDRVRDLALALRPSVLDDLGLPAAIRWYADRFARDAGLEAHLLIDAVPRLEPELETACFRVAQEALTNVARHARARHIWLELRHGAGRLELTVRDDGIGFDASAARERAIGGASLGLLGMQERISLVGGDYEVKTVPGGGTEIRAYLPVGDQEPRPVG